MNGKLVFRGGFLDCLKYIFNKDDARFISSNLAIEPSVPEFTTESLTIIANQFDRIANRSRRIQKPVMHLSLSPHPNDAYKLDDEQKQLFVQKLLTQIGMDNCQWILAEHNDTYTPDGQPRPHLHAVINRVPIDSNKAVNSSFIKWRVEENLQQLRHEYELTPVEASWQVKRKAPSTGQVRKYRQELEQYQSEKRTEPPELPIKVQLQNTIDKTAQNCTNLPQLVEQLSHQGIDIEIPHSPNFSLDSPQGIVYHWDKKYHFRASQLGRAYTLSGLQQLYHIDIDRDIDADKTTLSESNLSLENLSKARQKKSQSEL